MVFIVFENSWLLRQFPFFLLCRKGIVFLSGTFFFSLVFRNIPVDIYFSLSYKFDPPSPRKSGFYQYLIILLRRVLYWPLKIFFIQEKGCLLLQMETGVNMKLESSVIREAFVTFLARERLQFQMNRINMSLEFLVPRETFVTFLA